MNGKHVAFLAAVLSFGLALLVPTPVEADPDSRRLLESVDVQRVADGWEMRIAFNARVRYLRHAPFSHGDTIQIQVDPLVMSFADLPLVSRHESLSGVRGLSVPLVDVTYEGSVTADKLVIVHLSRPVGFTVRQGADFRSLVVTIADDRQSPAPLPAPAPAPAQSPAPLPAPEPAVPPAPPPREATRPSVPRSPRYVVQVGAFPATAGLPALPSGPALDAHAAYATEVQKDGATLRRLRVGPFDERASAERARVELAPSFPDAFVVEASAEDEAAAVASVVPRTGELAPGGRSKPTPAHVVAWAPTPGVAGDEVVQQSSALMAAGRAALTSGDLEQAVRSFTKVLSLPEHDATREAKELLGVARERSGQLAHAKAEYEEYVSHYPADEATTRVRQRLDALVSARAKLPAKAGGSLEPVTVAHTDVNGSASTQYRHEELRTGPAPMQTVDSSLYTDLLLITRTRTEDWNVRSQTAGSYRYDLLGGALGSEARISSLFVDASQRHGPYAAVLGRQPGNNAGVNSRFDGIRLSRRIAEHWKITALGGLPVELRHSDRIQTGRFLYGLSLDANHLFDHLDGEIFALQQHADGILDRTGVGGELRYADEGRFAALYVDYDVMFHALNTLLLTGNWQITPSTNLNVLFDRRNSPLLTSWNAIQGQPVTRVGPLLETFSESEVRGLARDRTPVSTMLSTGGSQQLLDWLQLALDVSASNLSATPASAGVDAMESTGWELAYFPQLIATSLLTEGDVGTLGVRYFQGKSSNTTSLIVNERIPLTRRLRITPRVRVDWRNRSGRDEFAPTPTDVQNDPLAALQASRVRTGSITLRPFLGAEYRIGHVTLDTDAGVEWTTGSFAQGAGDQFGWSLMGGIRYDF